MATASADRNLLFGILALQMDFISREALITAMNAWVLTKSKPLGQLRLEVSDRGEPGAGRGNEDAERFDGAIEGERLAACVARQLP